MIFAVLILLLSVLPIMRRFLSTILQPFCHFYYQKRYYRHHQGVRILMYHRVNVSGEYDQLTVSPERFEQHMLWLAQHYEVISLAQMQSQRHQPTMGKRPQVVLTFDDGYLDNLIYAIPILIQYKLPATIFVTTNFCQQTHQHPRYPASTTRLHLNWLEVRQLQKSPLITIGSHTCSHPNLPHLSSAQSWHEINQSRQLLAQQLGKAPDFFCYPSGYLSQRELDNVKKAGYLGAVTVAGGLNHNKTPAFALKRTEITEKDDIQDLKRKLDGAFDLPHQWLHWRRTRKNQ